MPRKKKDKEDSYPRANRKRKPLEITLSDEARAKLDRLCAAADGAPRSRIVEALVMAAYEPARPPPPLRRVK